MIRAILAPTDGSKYADKAVSLAGDFAVMHGARIILLHVVSDTISEAIPEGYRDLANAEHLQAGDILIFVGEKILGDAEARLRGQGVGEIETIMPRGRPTQVILDYAKARDVDLIVMGSRSLSPF